MYAWPRTRLLSCRPDAGNYGPEKCSLRNKNLLLGSVVEWRGQRTGPANLRTEQQNSPDVNNREKTDTHTHRVPEPGPGTISVKNSAHELGISGFSKTKDRGRVAESGSTSITAGSFPYLAKKQTSDKKLSKY